MINDIKKIKFLLNRSQKKSLILLTFLLFIGMIMEVLGLGAILPVITFILDSELLLKNEIINQYFGHIIIQYDYNTIAIAMLSGLVILYIIKTLFLAFLTYKQSVILENLSGFLRINLFKGYLNQPYSYHLNRDFSAILKNLQTEVFFFSSYCRSLLMVFVEVSLSIAVIGTIIFIEPSGALSIGALFIVLSLIFYQITKRKLSSWGVEREYFDKQLSRTSLESLSGIKDIKLLSRENNFLRLFKKITFNRIRISSYHETISQLPRFYLELVSVIGLVFFIAFMIYIGQNKLIMLSTLGVFVAASFRMIPSVNRIIGGLQNMKFYQSSIDVIYQELKSLNLFKSNNDYNNDISFEKEITLENLNYSYETNSSEILNNISLNISKGQTIGIIGKSGSGKSTIVDIINGLLEPTKGKICVDGINIKNKEKSWQRRIGYVGQDIFLFDDTIKKNICFGLSTSEIDDKRINYVLKAAQLFDFVKNLDNKIETIVGERGIQLSGGQKQRIGIARALYNDPDVLIFDEATASLDSKTEKEVMNSIYSLKSDKTIIIVAHRMSTLSNCDLIYEIIDGQINQKEKKWINTILQ